MIKYSEICYQIFELAIVKSAIWNSTHNDFAFPIGVMKFDAPHFAVWLKLNSKTTILFFLLQVWKNGCGSWVWDLLTVGWIVIGAHWIVYPLWHAVGEFTKSMLHFGGKVRWRVAVVLRFQKKTNSCISNFMHFFTRTMVGQPNKTLFLLYK